MIALNSSYLSQEQAENALETALQETKQALINTKYDADNIDKDSLKYSYIGYRLPDISVWTSCMVLSGVGYADFAKIFQAWSAQVKDALVGTPHLVFSKNAIYFELDALFPAQGSTTFLRQHWRKNPLSTEEVNKQTLLDWWAKGAAEAAKEANLQAAFSAWRTNLQGDTAKMLESLVQMPILLPSKDLVRYRLENGFIPNANIPVVQNMADLDKDRHAGSCIFGLELKAGAGMPEILLADLGAEMEYFVLKTGEIIPGVATNGKLNLQVFEQHKASTQLLSVTGTLPYKAGSIFVQSVSAKIRIHTPETILAEKIDGETDMWKLLSGETFKATGGAAISVGVTGTALTIAGVSFPPLALVVAGVGLVIWGGYWTGTAVEGSKEKIIKIPAQTIDIDISFEVSISKTDNGYTLKVNSDRFTGSLNDGSRIWIKNMSPK